MKYILVLGIEYKKFKKPAIITIRIGDRFLDTFTLEKDLPSKDMLSMVEQSWFHDLDRSVWITKEHFKKRWKDLPRFYKIYHLDDSLLGDKLRIHVNNDNSDYTNGFMKHSSMIRLSIASLFPKALVDEDQTRFFKTCVKFTRAFMKWERRTEEVKGKGISEKRRLSTWPLAESYHVKRDLNKHEQDIVADEDNWIGGSFTAEYEIRKKHHVKYLGSVRGKQKGFFFNKFPSTLVIASCKNLLNIYNEDQRSNNT